MPKNKTCFVLMPFGEKTDAAGQKIDFDEIYDYVIKPALEEMKITVIRCDEIPNAGSIHRDMLQHILWDDLAVVDLTTLNPNVFYELGVRHAVRRSGTILLRKKGTNIPFDIRGMRTFEYDLNPRAVAELKKTLLEVVKRALSSTASDSLVYDTFPDLQVTPPTP